MKIFAAIAVSALALSFSASAAQVVIECGSYSTTYNNAGGQPGGTPASSTITCPGQSQLSGISSSIYILFDVDYQNGNPTGGVTNSATSTYTGTGGFVMSSLLVTGTANSNQPSSEPVGSAPLNPQGIVGFGQYYGELLTDTNGNDTQTITYTDGANGETVNGVATVGAVGAASGAVYIVYNYSTGTPEPVSMILFGSGLLAVSLIGRKKFAKK